MSGEEYFVDLINITNSDSSSSESESGGEIEVECSSRDDFNEHIEVNQTIRCLEFQCNPLYGTDDERQRNLENSYDRIKQVFDQYLEQPHLLDPYIKDFISNILWLVLNENICMEVKHRAFKYLTLIIKVRGYKVVVTHLPHEVKDLEPVLQLLESQNPNDAETWETRYCLLIWLSIIIMMPFNMSVLDSGLQVTTVTNRLMDVCKVYLMGLDLCRDAAAVVLARFVTRDDVKIVHLQPFLDWLIETVVECVANNQEWQRFGPMACIAGILKHGKREDLLPLAPELLRSVIHKFKPIDQTYPLSAKSFIKILYRLGLVFLRPRVANWCYNRGTRNLMSNLAQSYQQQRQQEQSPQRGAGDAGLGYLEYPLQRREGDEGLGIEEEEEAEEEEADENQVCTELEEIIGELIDGLKTENSIARWAAAKGIGRIVSRLTRNNGDDVVTFVIELFELEHSVVAWHGACLAVAELAKRNLLLPERLPDVMPFLIKALVFEQIRGFTSVGTIVRDAACYVCWGIARAYHRSVIEPFIIDLATNLIAVACFDREVNCRRAAAAAFQELVGRLGNIPHGIDINTQIDYCSVHDRSSTYLEIAPKIALHGEYTQGLINHLMNHKLNNWDPVIRKCAAEALFKLTFCAPDYAATHCLQTLLHNISELNAYAMHGTILAIGKIVYAISTIENCEIDENTLGIVENLISRDMTKELRMVPALNSPTNALLNFIENCAKAHLPFHGKQVIGEWQYLIDRCLGSEKADLRNDAVSAFKHLCMEYYSANNEEIEKMRGAIMQRYIDIVTIDGGVLGTRIGHTLALGSVPPCMVRGCLSDVIYALERCTTITRETIMWTPARKAALEALTTLCTTLGLRETGEVCCYEYLEDILDVFVLSMQDYTVDTRGDIGACVREAAMLGAKDLVLMAVDDDAPELLSPNTVVRVFASVAQQAVERIDRTRAIAGKVFATFLMKKDKPVPHIPAEGKVRAIFTENVCKQTDWMTPQSVSLFIRLQTMPQFSYNILLGLTSSIGSLNEPVSGRTCLMLFTHYVDQPQKSLERLINDALRIFETYQNNDRVTLPLLNFLETILTWNNLLEVVCNPDNNYAIRLLDLGKKEITKSTNTKKLTAGIAFYCQMIQVPGEVSRRALAQLCIMLLHRFLWLRRITATKFGDAVKMYAVELKLQPEVLQEIKELLDETDWTDSDKNMLREKRNAICALLNIPAPVLSSGGVY